MIDGRRITDWTASKHAPGATALSRLLVTAAVSSGLLLTGCAPLLTGTTDPAQVKAIMESTNARGCIYARASAAPWAQATTVIIGTWGQDGPRFEDCWKGIPPGIP